MRDMSFLQYSVSRAAASRSTVTSNFLDSAAIHANMTRSSGGEQSISSAIDSRRLSVSVFAGDAFFLPAARSETWVSTSTVVGVGALT